MVIKEQIGVKEPFPATNLPIYLGNLLHKDKEQLALRNNFRVTKKFLLGKFDCTTSILNMGSVIQQRRCLNISTIGPTTAMGLSAMYTFQLDNTKRETLPTPHCHNGSCR